MSLFVKEETKRKVEHISAKPLQMINNSQDPICQPVKLNGKPFIFEVETGSPDKFCSKDRVVCLVKQLNLQLNPANPKLLAKESSKDPVISSVVQYIKEGWPQALSCVYMSTCSYL